MMGRTPPRPAIPIEIRLGQEKAANARLISSARTALAIVAETLRDHHDDPRAMVNALLDIHLALSREVSGG